MTKKAWRWLIYVIWLVALTVTKILFGTQALGLYVLGSVLYAAFIMLCAETHADRLAVRLKQVKRERDAAKQALLEVIQEQALHEFRREDVQ